MKQKIPEIIHESWHKHLQPLFDDPKMLLLKKMLFSPDSIKSYPAKENIFRVFRMPLDKIKVVLLGQDPYPNGEAIGYAFAVDEKTKIPASLDIIRKEVINSGVERDTKTNIDASKWRELAHWRQQGVFLLNAALTVEARNQNSHVGQWSWFTREVIKIISLYCPNRPIWILWGSKAKSNKGFIHSYYTWQGNIIAGNYSYVLEGNHPAAEAYPNSPYKFSGCNHFKICNEILKAKKQSPINW